jgi:hypothetical protein
MMSLQFILFTLGCNNNVESLCYCKTGLRHDLYLDICICFYVELGLYVETILMNS